MLSAVLNLKQQKAHQQIEKPFVMSVLLSYDFTPLDSSAVYVLSSMARQRRASRSSGEAVSPDRDTLQGAVLQIF